MPVRILAFAGSTRAESLNKKLVRIAAAGATNAGGEVTLIDLRDLPMPLYDGDLEAAQGLPAHALTFKRLLREHQALLIASPEYNSSLPGVLKNAIDWASRALPGEAPLTGIAGKVVGLLSASPGALGGMRSLAVLRMMFGNLRCLVIPETCSVDKAHQAFTPEGALQDAAVDARVRAVGARLVEVTAALAR